MEASKRERIVLFGIVPPVCVVIGAVANRYIGPSAQCPVSLESLNSSSLLLGGLVLISFVFALLAVLMHDPKKRENAGAAALGAVGLLCLFASGIALGSADPAPTLSSDEIIILANSAEQRGDFDAAIDHLQTLRRRGTTGAMDERLVARIEALERAQAERTGPIAPANMAR